MPSRSPSPVYQRNRDDTVMPLRIRKRGVNDRDSYKFTEEGLVEVMYNKPERREGSLWDKLSSDQDQRPTGTIKDLMGRNQARFGHQHEQDDYQVRPASPLARVNLHTQDWYDRSDQDWYDRSDRSHRRERRSPTRHQRTYSNPKSDIMSRLGPPINTRDYSRSRSQSRSPSRER